MNETITVNEDMRVPIEIAWKYWTDPTHITGWCFASEDWECPRASSDLRIGGRFVTTMSAKDRSQGFDFSGTYTDVVPFVRLAYTMDDNRTAVVTFTKTDLGTKVSETFEMELENSREVQEKGWNAILHNFKQYAETNYSQQLP